MVKSLVTGGAGFIGSNLVEHLLELDHEVVCIDNESSVSHDRFYWSRGCDNHKVDICNFDSIKSLFKDVDYVFHLAAEARIMNCISNPLGTIKSNVLGTANVLQASRENNVKRVVYASTSSAYGNNSIPNVETQPDDCLNPYSVSKVSGEKICCVYSKLFDLPTVILRYFNVYGKNQPNHGPYAPVIGIFLRQKSKGEPLTIVGDGTQRRDFTNVQDVVKANILASTTNLSKDLFGTVFNVGTQKNYSVIELANLISDKYVFLEKRIGEMQETMADITKTKTLLGWEPKIDLKDWIFAKVSSTTNK